MITVRTDTGHATSLLRALAANLGPTMDDTIGVALDEVIQQLQAVTPVRTGRMKAGYATDHPGSGHWTLSDEAPYAGYVIGGTRRMAPSTALNAVLDSAEADIEDLLGVAIERLVHDLR